MKDLKPCPFCGKMPVITYKTEYREVVRGILVNVELKCPFCKISKEKILPASGKADEIVSGIQQLVEDWNRRA